MEEDAGFREHRERLTRLHREMDDLLDQADSDLDDVSAAGPGDEGIERLDRSQTQLKELFAAYLAEASGFVEYVREQARKIEEANRKAAMSEKRPKSERDQARIQELSEELTRELRLERVDAALKELTDFLSDADFFAANATTGRKRKLRALQNAIEKALAK